MYFCKTVIFLLSAIPTELQYPSIPEGSRDQFPDTLTGIARWLLVNR